MCGIAGIVAREPAEDVVRRMLARIAHRGPDGEGLAVRRVGKRIATFGHRRLSIVDLEGGAQPMEDAGTDARPIPRAIATFNGEIYDHRRTRDVLAKEGARFVTRSDTETLVSGFAQLGEDVVPRLGGMFAFAAMDLRSGDVLLARDRSGIKPLFWTRLDEGRWPGGGLAFASELDALLEVPGIAHRVCPDGLASFLFSDYAHPPHTLVLGAQKLAPGELLILRADGSYDGPRRYVPPQVPEDGPTPTAAELLRVLGDAVESQLMSDVPLGVFLSGGLDSSVVAALARARSKVRLQAFCIAFEETSFDESAHARAVSAHLGLEHVEEVLTPRALLDVVDEVLDHLDEPLGDHSIVPTYLLCRLAARHVKVALGGDGADELFGGYPTYVAHVRHAALAGPLVSRARRLLGARGTASLLERIPASDAYQSLDWKVKRFVGRWDDDVVQRHLRWMSTIDLPELPSALNARWAEGRWTGLPATIAERHPFWGDPIETATTLDFATYMPGSVLTKVDRASMAHGLEARPPFLDEGVLALARRLPSSARVQGRVGKVLLREAARSLVPPAILERPKHGFSVPLAAWLRGPLAPRLGAILSSSPVWDVLDRATFDGWERAHRARRGDHSKALWALLVLDRWMRRTGLGG